MNILFKLRVKFYLDKSLPLNAAELVEYHLRAAQWGCADSQYALGNMYYSGGGVHQDNVEAAKWYHRAAWNGCANAKCVLGGMYLYGFGVSKDINKAINWYRMAAEQGHFGAHELLKEKDWQKSPD